MRKRTAAPSSSLVSPFFFLHSFMSVETVPAPHPCRALTRGKGRGRHAGLAQTADKGARRLALCVAGRARGQRIARHPGGNRAGCGDHPFEKAAPRGGHCLRALGLAVLERTDDSGEIHHDPFSPTTPRAGWGRGRGDGVGHAQTPASPTASRREPWLVSGLGWRAVDPCARHLPGPLPAQWRVTSSPSLTVAGAAPASHRLPNSPPREAAP